MSSRFSFHKPNMIISTSNLAGSVIAKPDIHNINWSHKRRDIGHRQNKCITVSFSLLHNEHSGLSALLNLKSLSFKNKMLFNILY